MIVYVESNYVLQLALKQEYVSSAEAILELAEEGKIDLVMPAFALSEPFSTLTYRAQERILLYNSLMKQLAQLQRSQSQQQVVSTLQPLLDGWLRSNDVQELQAIAQRFLKVGKLIETTGEIFEQALGYQDQYDLSPQDSIIYAAVISDLRQRTNIEAKCFLSTNWKDFDYLGIRAELKTYNCVYISRFDNGVEFIKHDLS